MKNIKQIRKENKIIKEIVHQEKNYCQKVETVFQSNKDGFTYLMTWFKSKTKHKPVDYLKSIERI